MLRGRWECHATDRDLARFGALSRVDGKKIADWADSYDPMRVMPDQLACWISRVKVLLSCFSSMA